MIKVQCPACQRRYRTVMEAFGRTAVCSRCKRGFKIGESRPPFEWKSTDLAEDSWIGVEAPQEKVERKHCIICDAPLRPGEVRCPECGVNQVTGVVQKKGPRGETRERSIGEYLPLRTILILAIIGGIACLSYLAIAMIGKSAAQTAEQLADERVLREATDYLRQRGDEFTFSDVFGGRVNDKNVPRLIKRLSAGDAMVRKAAALLIAAGKIDDVTPVVEWARGASDRPLVNRVLGGIGARRLVQISNSDSARARQSAADAMLLLCGVRGDAEKSRELAEKTESAQKAARYNELCRFWPEAVGRFHITAGEKTAPFEANVEQMGCTFYLRLGSCEFVSVPGERRQFDIPIEQYCAATGTAVSAQYVRDLMAGQVKLSSPLGVGWEGMIQANLKRTLDGPLPGFLPLQTPPADGSIALPILLRRQAR